MRSILLTITILLLCSPIQVFSEANTEEANSLEEADISEAQEVLFNVSNFKPGDSFTQVLIVKNSGQEDFEYNAKSNFTAGYKDLYEQLLVKVEDANKTVLYEGSLSSFSKFASRSLVSGGTEDLFFTIVIPDLDNKFQGTFCEFEFGLYVEGTIGGILPADGPKVPSIGPGMTDEIITSTSAALFTGGMMFYLLQRRRKQIKNNEIRP
ncbi:cell wall protein [Bacillus sp. V5-8f]|uniref:cell wall protein n=1 Tax=Bacillus sp. V5-8f TaxID=2053044 RepID=UPI000C777097|nr:cell wall protein [Bacillus sp. V5-8f]PLT33454.1 cell wall protein [Bacillus sp. V5-8f]